MNAVEIEEAISNLAAEPFDAAEFPFAFLEAFGNKATTIKRLRSGSSNSSDIEGGVLQRNNIHIAVCPVGEVTRTLAALKASPATAKAKAKFVLATDGITLEAEDLTSGDTIAPDYPDFANNFGFFLSLAGITTVKAIRNNPIDIQATSRLNRLYVELLKENEDWASEDRRHDMNQFMARLIFCFFAEDTDIFNGEGLFTSTIEQMSDSRSGNTHEVIAELFRAMDTKIEDRKAAGFRSWADKFPYVNGGLFEGSLWQLEVARECEFSVPDTLFTSNKDDIVEFVKLHEKCIFKEVSGSTHVLTPTRLMEDRFFELSDNMSVCPTIFQEYIQGQTEYRVIVIDEKIEAVSFDIANLPYPYDVRLNDRYAAQRVSLTQKAIQATSSLKH